MRHRRPFGFDGCRLPQRLQLPLQLRGSDDAGAELFAAQRHALDIHWTYREPIELLDRVPFVRRRSERDNIVKIPFLIRPEPVQCPSWRASNRCKLIWSIMEATFHGPRLELVLSASPVVLDEEPRILDDHHLGLPGRRRARPGRALAQERLQLLTRTTKDLLLTTIINLHFSKLICQMLFS